MIGRLRVRLTWYLTILTVAFSTAANPPQDLLKHVDDGPLPSFFDMSLPVETGQPVKSDKLTRVVWTGVEIFQDAYAYNGHINTAATLDNDYFHRIIINFT